MMHPELLATFIHSGQPLFVRQETRAGEGRIDVLIYFYGSAHFDIIECKGRAQPLIGTDGRLTAHCWKALEQVSQYRDDVSNGRCDITGIPVSGSRPRLILIGCSDSVESTAEEEQAIIDNGIRESKWAAEFSVGALTVTSWRALAERTIAEGSDTVAALRYDGLQGPNQAEINFVARGLLAESAQVVHDRREQRGASARGSLRSEMESYVATNGVRHMETLLLECSDEDVRSVSARAYAILETLDTLQLVTHKCMDPARANTLLQIADLLLYRADGDMPCGRWEHGATYPLIDVLSDNEKAMEQIGPQIVRVLSSDSSEDAIGRTSHIARFLPKPVVASWMNDSTFARRWILTNPHALRAGTMRPRLVPLLHIGYCLAQHGVSEALDFMNECAANGDIVADIALWNQTHAARNPQPLTLEIAKKAASEDEDLVPFRAWHKAIHEATAKVALRMTPRTET